MRRWRPARPGRAVVVAGAVVVTVAAARCTSPAAAPAQVSPSLATTPVVITASSILAVGPNRFLFSLVDRASGRSLARPDLVPTVRFTPGGGDASTTSPPTVATFVWAIEGLRGLYIAEATFAAAGTWTARVSVPGSSGSSTAVSETAFSVRDRRPGIAVGDPAPPVRTRSSADVGGDLRRLTTDVNPDARLYRRSLAQALAEHQPILLVFGSPGMCTTGFCAPILETVKSELDSWPTVTFIQLEAYAMAFDGRRLQPSLDGAGQLRPSEALAAFGLPSETTVVAIDRSGHVTDILDLFASRSEISAALARIE